MALSVIRMSSGQTSVQHLVMLQRPMPSSLSLQLTCAREAPSSGCISSESGAYEEPRSSKLLLLAVIAQDVADVLAEEALNALAKFLYAIDVPVGPSSNRCQVEAGTAGIFVIDSEIPGDVR